MIRPRLIIIQPTPYCNISCSYCYLAHRDDRRLMPAAVVEAVRNKIFRRLARDSAPTVVWHAGEPTTAPIAWYEHAYDRFLSACPANTKFAMQTNGIAINDHWIELFRRTNTEIGLSIDGPQRFHDACRRTRSSRPTWALAMRGLQRLQHAGLQPRVITVLHPDGLNHPDEYYRFYRDHDLRQIGFNIDEKEGANGSSRLGGRCHKEQITAFLLQLMTKAYRDGFPLEIREVERIAQVLIGADRPWNEQVEPWASIVVAANGSVSSFSPEFMETEAPEYDNFVFGNILEGDLEDFARSERFTRVAREVAAGVDACRSNGCRYFAVCGGGAPVNKYCETGSLRETETNFCRNSIQTAADALMAFVGDRHHRKHHAGAERLEPA
jgi:uncharacterized protein